MGTQDPAVLEPAAVDSKSKVEWVAAEVVTRRKKPGVEYAPLLETKRYPRWRRLELYLESGVHQYSPFEREAIGRAVATLTRAVGEPVFSLSPTSTGDFPVETQVLGLSGYAGFGSYHSIVLDLVNIGHGPSFLSDLEHVTLHELGHMAGLGHHEGKGVMRPGNFAALTYSQPEVETLRLIYQSEVPLRSLPLGGAVGPDGPIISTRSSAFLGAAGRPIPAAASPDATSP